MATRFSKSKQLKDRLLKVIAHSEGGVDTRFPSVRQIATDHSVSIITANKVVSNLIALGFLVKREGIGTFIATPKVSGDAVRNVALCLGPTTFSVFFLALFAELTSQARQMGINMQVFSDGNPAAG